MLLIATILPEIARIAFLHTTDTSRTRISHMQLLNSCISFDEAVLREFLPLAPGGVASLPVTLHGVHEPAKEGESPVHEAANR